MEEVMTLANTSRVRHRQRMHMAARRSKGAVAAGTWRLITLKRHLGRRARNQESEPPFRRDSLNCWQPEEKEMSVCTRRPLCPEGKKPRASERQITEQVGVLFHLKLKFRRYLSSEKLSLCRGTTLKLTAAQRSSRDWCSGGQETRSAWLPNGPLTLKSCSGQQQELDVETVT